MKRLQIIAPENNRGKAVITLQAFNLTPSMPSFVGPIPVERKVRNLYFLHAAAYGYPGDIGEYIMTYTDDSTVAMKMSIPENCNNWWVGYTTGEKSRPVPIEVSNTITGKPAWRYLRVAEWQNPHPEKIIRSISIKSFNSSQTPIILAISGTEW